MSFPAPPEKCTWPKPWRFINSSESSQEVLGSQPYEPDPRKFTFEAELQHEVCPSHPLYRVNCRAVARSCEHPDEFIFLTDRPDMPLAFVHLTWRVEEDPEFPYTIGYPSWEAFNVAWTAGCVDHAP